MYRECGNDDAVDRVAIDAVASELLAAARIEAPPVDAFAVARSLGIAVIRDEGQGGRARLARLQSRSGERQVIFLNRDPRAEREHWAVAHELGEHLAPTLFASCGIDPQEPAAIRERLANQFASGLLLPREWFTEWGRAEHWSLPRLKLAFSTASHELIARRMLDMHVPVIISIFDRGKLSWRLSNMGGRAPKLSAPEIDCQRQANETGEEIEIRLDQADIFAWPIHEPDWKREIVRTEINELCE